MFLSLRKLCTFPHFTHTTCSVCVCVCSESYLSLAAGVLRESAMESAYIDIRLTLTITIILLACFVD